MPAAGECAETRRRGREITPCRSRRTYHTHTRTYLRLDLSSYVLFPSVPGVRRATGTRVVAAPPPQVSSSGSSGLSSLALAYRAATEQAMKKRTSATLSQQHASAAAMHEFDDRARHKRPKATPSQVMADELAQVRIIEPPTPTHVLERNANAHAAAMAYASRESASSYTGSLQRSQSDPTALLTPATEMLVDVDTPLTASSSCIDEFECEESLDDMPDSHASSPNPDQLASLTPVVTPATTESTSLHLPASAYRSYHSKEPLIVSVETSLAEFNPDLERHMWDSEQQFQPYLYYLMYQTHLDASMRPMLVDWMFEVGAEYCLSRETVYLAINYVDRFLSASPTDLPADGTSRSVVDRKTLQLLGVTCLWIASKIEEIFPPSPEDFAVCTDHAYDAGQLVNMEPVVLRVLNWRLHAQTPFSWLKLFLKKAATLLYDEFKRRAQMLFEASVPNTPATPCVATSSSGVTPSTPVLTVSQAHHQFSLLQLDFLAELEYLLSSAWFVRMMELLDVISLDMHSLRFYPSHLAAAVLFVVHPVGTALHDLVAATTTYTATQLAPAIALISMFKDMPYRGPPSDERRSFMADLKVPYDEFHSRQVHNPDGLSLLNAALESIAAKASAAAEAASAAATAAAESGVDPADAPAVSVDDGLEAYCHTNIFRNLPSFLDGALWTELRTRGLLRPIRNNETHQMHGLWVTDPDARHDDPTSFGPIGLPEPNGLETLHLDPDTAAVVAAAIAASPNPLSASTPAPVVPATDSFLAAAAAPYARLPKEATRPEPTVAAVTHATKPAAPAPAPAALNMHSAASSSVAVAASASASTTIYTFGGAPAAAPAVATASKPPPAPQAPGAPVKASSGHGTRVYASAPRDEWLTSDDEDVPEEMRA